MLILVLFEKMYLLIITVLFTFFGKLKGLLIAIDAQKYAKNIPDNAINRILFAKGYFNGLI